MSLAEQISNELWACHLSVVPYNEALATQQHICRRRQAGELPDMLLLLEHPPVYTCGRRADAGELPLGETFYRSKGIDVHATDRGGKVTYHGPGQLVGYPIVRIDDVGAYLRTMEDALIAALAEVGIAAGSRHGEGIDYTGVWVDERKIASIGVHVSRGVTTHGFAINFDNDLEPFSWVVACGLPDVTMTSVARELVGADGARELDAVRGANGAPNTPGGCESLSCFRRRVAHNFARAFGRRQRLVTPARLGIDTANPTPRASGRALRKTSPSPAAEPVPA